MDQKSLFVIAINISLEQSATICISRACCTLSISAVLILADVSVDEGIDWINPATAGKAMKSIK